MSTPPLSRNKSSSNLGLNNPTDQKQTIGGSTNSPSADLEKGDGKPWKAAQGGADAAKRPTLSSKRSQPNLFINMDSQPVSSSHTPPVARDINSTPKKPTTSSSATLVPLSFAEAPSTPKSPNSSSSATQALASPKASEKGGVHVSDLPKALSMIIDLGIQNHILKPEKLALLLVTVDNQYGKKKGDESIKTMLREPLFIIDYRSAAGTLYEKLNIIEKYCEPFISHHLDHPKLDELLQKVMREYDKVGDKVTKLSEGLRAVEQVNHPEIVALMAPLMKLVGDYFFGSDMKLKSSKFPEPIKKLLIDIDRQVIAQFEKNGSGEMRELLQRRKSALVGFISTFSFMTIWAPKLAADTKKSAGFYAKLSSYINSYLVNKLDRFVIDILINQEHQSEKAKKHVGDYAKELKLTAQSASKLQLAGAEKGGMLSSIKGLLSPRSSSISQSSAASKEVSDEDSGFNEEAARQREMQRNRIKKLAKFAETAGFDKISSEFFVLIRNKIIDLKAKDYNAFTKDPVDYCHKQLEVFKMQKGEKNTDPELFEKIELSINSYYENLKRKNEEKKAWLNSPEMTLEDEPHMNSIEDEKVDEKGVAAESSSLASDKKAGTDVKTDSIQVSEKTESDSSTSVETEKSDD
jgi:hypothetical protein